MDHTNSFNMPPICKNPACIGTFNTFLTCTRCSQAIFHYLRNMTFSTSSQLRMRRCASSTVRGYRVASSQCCCREIIFSKSVVTEIAFFCPYPVVILGCCPHITYLKATIRSLYFPYGRHICLWICFKNDRLVCGNTLSETGSRPE